MNIRKFATPLTIGSFFLMAVTGLLMYFHLDIGFNKQAHVWFSVVFVAGVILHMVVNFPAFKRHFMTVAGASIIGVFIVLLGSSFMPAPAGAGGSPVPMVMNSVANAPMSDLAALVGKPVEQLLVDLKAAGHAVSPDSTITQLAGDDREASGKLIQIIFGKAGAK